MNIFLKLLADTNYTLIIRAWNAHTKLDAKCDYWQIKVDEESSKIPTFSTPFADFDLKRVPSVIHKCKWYFPTGHCRNQRGLWGGEE